jgi:serine/threonine protein kinase
MNIDAVMLVDLKGMSFHSIPAGATTVGRSPDSDLVVAAPSVSRKHALLEREGDFVWVIDLDSRNGTYVNQERLESGVRLPLRRLDRLSFGSDRHEFLIEGNRSLDDTTCSATTAPTGPGATIDLMDDKGSSSNFGFSAGTIDFLDEGIDLRTSNQLMQKYRPLRVLNRGGMGKIFLVQERLSGRIVALKVMHDRYVTSTPHVHQFVREAVITARLQHPNIIPVHDIGFIQGNQLYYTMRYVEGESFGRSLGRAPLDARLAILRAAARAVDHAHDLGLWHRDMKPENILVGKDFARSGEVFVIDWGLVSVQPGRDYKLDLPEVLVERRSFAFEDRLIEDTNEALSTLNLDPNPGSGAARLIGTPAYMAPEQCRNDPMNMGAISDVWAFGVMLFEALTDQHPIPEHRDLGPVQIISRILQRDAIAPSSIRPAVPRYLDSICLQMLMPPEDRMRSLKPFITALENPDDS